jgi:hypothetical protein
MMGVVKRVKWGQYVINSRNCAQIETTVAINYILSPFNEGACI